MDGGSKVTSTVLYTRGYNTPRKVIIDILGKLCSTILSDEAV